MKPLLLVCAAIAWATGALGCGSGTAGPAVPPFDPFGSEAVDKTGGEPAVSGTDPGPGGGAAAQSIPQLCATDCARIEAACPGAAGDTCVASCTALPARYPQCMDQAQAYLACVAKAPLGCQGGSVVDISGCDGTGMAFSQCANGSGATGGSASGGSAAGSSP